MPQDMKWNLKMVRATQALAMLPRVSGSDDEIDWGEVEVAHIDTGATRHSVFGPWIGDDSPVLEPARGLNLQETGQPPFDPMTYRGFPGHGTRTQSVLCADLPGDFVGVAPGLPTVPYRVTNSVVIASRRTQKKVAAAIRHAVDVSNCEVVSISLGHIMPGLIKNPMGAAVDHAYENGVIIVAAGGQGVDRVTYPGKFFRSIGCGGVKPNREVWWEYAKPESDETGTDQTQFVDVWGPADEVLRANSKLANGDVVDGELKEGDGTSYATVHVAAAAGMWLAFHGSERLDAAYPEPWQRIEAFRKLLKGTKQDIVGDYQPSNGSGILDIKAVLEAGLPAAESLEKETRPAEGQNM